MNRAEFMAALEAQLRDITTEERDEALKFYNEYLDEAGPENEAAVLAELGSPQKVACIIRANCGFGVPAVRDAAEKSTAPEKPEQAPVPELTLDGPDWQASQCALPGFVDSKNEEKTERNAGYLVVSHSGGGMLRQGTRKGIRRTPANRGMRAHRIVKSLDISEDVCHGLCP